MRSVLIASLLAFSSPARAQQADGNELVPQRDIPAGVQQVPKGDDNPRLIRWMIKPLKRGMFIRLPIIDTDPNRGVTVGVMPIAVIQGKTDDRIRQIHAPSLTYNKNFVVTPTYRFYSYPQEDSSLVLRGSAGKYENEVMGEYEDGSFHGTAFDLRGRVQFNTDAGQRFYGFGPNSTRAGEANYREGMFMTRLAAGHPLSEGSKWRARVSSRFQASRFTNGPIPNLPSFTATYPGQATERRQQTHETRVAMDYDTRDHATTTGKGEFAQVFAESSVRGLASQYDYSRWGAEGKIYVPWPSDEGKVFAAQVKMEQLTGPTAPPFWLQSRLGGKYSLRAYGDGRYIDRGMSVVNLEQRIRLFEHKTAGVTTEFQAAPFVGAGTVFDSPKTARFENLRTVVGAGIRAVAKPQVVGSVDFGVGREGLSVFMDINYSF